MYYLGTPHQKSRSCTAAQMLVCCYRSNAKTCRKRPMKGFSKSQPISPWLEPYHQRRLFPQQVDLLRFPIPRLRHDGHVKIPEQQCDQETHLHVRETGLHDQFWRSTDRRRRDRISLTSDPGSSEARRGMAAALSYCRSRKLARPTSARG